MCSSFWRPLFNHLCSETSWQCTVDLRLSEYYYLNSIVRCFFFFFLRTSLLITQNATDICFSVIVMSYEEGRFMRDKLPVNVDRKQVCVCVWVCCLLMCMHASVDAESSSHNEACSGWHTRTFWQSTQLPHVPVYLSLTHTHTNTHTCNFTAPVLNDPLQSHI